MSRIILEETDDIIETSHEAAQSGLERIASRLLAALAFLLPAFCIPHPVFPLVGAKATLLFLAVVIASAFFIIARLKNGRFRVLASPILGALAAVSLVFIFSSFFGSAPFFSFAGQGFEVGTTLFVTLSSVLVFLLSSLILRGEQIFGCYLAFLAAFFFIAVFHLLRLVFGADLLSFGIFTDVTANLLGRWNDLGIFFGVSTLLSLFTLEFLSLNKLFRMLLWCVFLLSLFFLAVINFPLIWFTLGLFALVFMVYRISFGLGASHFAPRFSAPSLIALLVPVLFILVAGPLGTYVDKTFGTSVLEARPSWQATFEVAKHTLVERPLFGAGPNRFSGEWLKWRPAGVNATIFWNIDFENGVGLIPTFLSTTGIFGILAWILFFLFFLYAGFRAMLREGTEIFPRYLVVSSFSIALFLFVFSIFYVPSDAIFGLSFFFTGLFVAALGVSGETEWKTVSFANSPRSGFISVLLLILLLIGSIALGYFLVEKYLSLVYFQRGVIAMSRDGNLAAAETAIGKAVRLSPAPAHFRALTELSLVRMNTFLQKNAKDAGGEAVRAEFQGLFGTALAYAREALALDPSQYQSFLELGRVYEAVVPLKAPGAYENAHAAYERALTLNPQSPAILLTIARLEIAKGDHAKAREYIGKTLAQKNNYLEAIFLLSALEVEDGNLKAAIDAAEAAAFIAPNDSAVLFQLGLLRFNDTNYRGAIDALERAVATTPAYANAKYYLGLSYEKAGRSADALQQFTDLLATNPDNTALARIVANMKAGRSSSSAVTSEKTEKRTLPVPEKEATKKKRTSFDEE